MNNNNYLWIAPLVSFLVPAIGWILREIYFRREKREKAAADASEILKEKKELIEEQLS